MILVLHGRGNPQVLRFRRIRSPEALRGRNVVGLWAAAQKRVPDWVANVRADPSVVVTLKRRSISMTAVELVGRDHAETWPGLVRVWPRLRRYEQRAGRPIPVFRLTRS